MKNINFEAFYRTTFSKKNILKKERFMYYQLSSCTWKYKNIQIWILIWFMFIERKPKTEDKQTIAMLRSKIYTLEQELEQQKNQKVCRGVPNCVNYTIFQWGCLLCLNWMNLRKEEDDKLMKSFNRQLHLKICV